MRLRLANGDLVAVPPALSGAAVATASYVIGSKRGDVRVDVALAGMAAFLFGLLARSPSCGRRERLALVHGLVSSGDAGLLSIPDAMLVFAPEDRASVRDLIDLHLIDLHLTDQIDYRLVDYHRADDSYERLTGAVLALRPDTQQQEAVYKELVGLCIRMSADRARDAAGGQQMSRVEWAGLLMLLVVLLAVISVLPGGTVPGALVVGALGASQ